MQRKAKVESVQVKKRIIARLGKYSISSKSKESNKIAKNDQIKLKSKRLKIMKFQSRSLLKNI